MVRIIHEGGPTVLWIFALVVPALALVTLHIVMRRRWSLWASLGAIALILMIGIYGMTKGQGMTDDAANYMRVSEADRKLLIERGYAEANRPLEVAGVVGGILGIGVIVGQLRRREAR